MPDVADDVGELSPPRWPRWLVAAGIVVLAFNLRPTALSVGPQLGAIRQGLGLTAGQAGLLTTLPVLCFAGFGVLAPSVARRLGLHRTILAGLVLVVAGQLIRASTASPAVFLVASAGALAGMAGANVLLPSVVKRHFPDRIGLLTATYSTVLTIGVSTAGFLSVPIAEAAGGDDGWRWGLRVWAGTALLAVPLWVVLSRRDRPEGANGTSAPARISLRAVARTRLGWVMAMFFGLQSINAYVVFGWLPSIYASAGFSAATSGAFLGITTAASIPLAFLFPAYTVRRRRPVELVVLMASACLGGFVGLLIAPRTLPWLWPLLLAIGTSSFPVSLALMGLRSRTSDGTSALSGFAQSVGYLLAVPGPFLVGLLHDRTGSWTVPLVALSVLTAPLLLFGVLATAPRVIEDEIEAGAIARDRGQP